MQPDAGTDFLIVGAGFAGLIAAERLANAGWRCVVIDQPFVRTSRLARFCVMKPVH